MCIIILFIEPSLFYIISNNDLTFYHSRCANKRIPLNPIMSVQHLPLLPPLISESFNCSLYAILYWWDANMRNCIDPLIHVDYNQYVHKYIRESCNSYTRSISIDIYTSIHSLVYVSHFVPKPFIELYDHSYFSYINVTQSQLRENPHPLEPLTLFFWTFLYWQSYTSLASYVLHSI